MKVYVINLRGQAERRRRAGAQLAAKEIDFEFFPALDGDTALARGVFDRIDADEFLLNTGRRVTPGEIGCFASHRALWELATMLDEPLMIMEDDFNLLDSFPRAFDSARRMIGKTGFLRLQVDRNARKLPVASCGDFTVSLYTKPPHCLMCYCIAPRVAARFLDQTHVLDAPVDVFIKQYWTHGQPLYALTPYSVAPSVLSSVTTITGRKKRPKPLAVSIRRFLRKCSGHLRRWTCNRRFRRRPVERRPGVSVSAGGT